MLPSTSKLIAARGLWPGAGSVTSSIKRWNVGSVGGLMSARCYNYSIPDVAEDFPRSIERAVTLGRERLDPALRNPDYLLYRCRRQHFQQCLARLPDQSVDVLDVGGRIQPFRPLLEGRVNSYIAVDRQLEGLLDVAAKGESLPFMDESFDFVICTQVLGYVDDPRHFVEELRRVLRKGGYLFMTVPAFSPQHHDERWRFLPDGLRELLRGYRQVDIVPEGGSVAGIIRSLNDTLDQLERPLVRKVAAGGLIPVLNWIGEKLDCNGRRSQRFTANYSVIAVK